MWNKKYKKCIDCGTIKRPFFAKGLCLACYSRKRYKNPEFKKKHKEYVYKWIKEHPERLKEIMRKAKFKKK